MKISIGTRSSALAIWQTHFVVDRLKSFDPGLDIEIKQIKTLGDKVRDRALSQVGGQGLFVTEIENALLSREIDLAVHSLKDMPTEQPDGLSLGAILERADPRDALVVRDGSRLSDLPVGARVGTGSLRRRAQLLAARPDLVVLDLRGNVDTRLQKLNDGQYDAIVLAVAGLVRLNRADAISQILPVDIMITAVGQGALCMEVRSDDHEIRTLIAPLDYSPTHLAAKAERAFLRKLEGGCQVPVGAFAWLDGEILFLDGMIASPDGSRLLRDRIQGPAIHATRLGINLAEEILEAGGRMILEETKRGL